MQKTRFRRDFCSKGGEIILKTDQTKLALVVSLLDCLLKKEYTEITAQEIYTGANISKRTFYNYFRDKYDLLPWFWRFRLNKYFYRTLPEYYLQQLYIIKQYPTQFQRAFDYHGQNNFVDYAVVNTIEKYRLHVSKTIYEKYPEHIVESALLYSARASVGGTVVFSRTKEDLDALISNAEQNPDVPLRLYAISIFSDYLSFEPYPNGMHL